MRTIETTVIATEDGRLIAPKPLDVAPGEYRVVIVIEEQPVEAKKHSPLNFSAYPVGPVSDNFTFRREDLYNDNPS